MEDASKGPLIKSYRRVEPRRPSLSKTESEQPPARHSSRRPWWQPRLPALLRPTSYPFSRPVSLLIIALLPVALPTLVSLLLVRFLMQSAQSRRRIRSVRRAKGDGRAGALARVGLLQLRDAVRQVAENVDPENPEDIHSLSGQATEAEHTPQKSRGGEPARWRFYKPRPEDEHLETDPLLTADQLEMIDNLNAIPQVRRAPHAQNKPGSLTHTQMRKHLSYLPHVRNAHGMLIARDTSFPDHVRLGLPMVHSWASELVF